MKRILIMRPDGIGDFIIFTAVLGEYARRFSEYEIHLLCQPAVKNLAEAIPFIKQVICIDMQKLFQKKYFIYTIFINARMSMMNYSKIIYPVYSRHWKSERLLNLIKAKEKYAFDGDSANDQHNERYKRNYYFTNIIESENFPKVELERNIEFINRLGGKLQLTSSFTQIWFKSQDESEYQELCKLNNLEKDNYFVLSPGAGKSIKYWPNRSWIKLIKHITIKYPQYKIVIVGSKHDVLLINDIVSNLNIEGNKIIDFSQKASLRVTAKIIEGAKLLIGTDSASVHLAAAVRTFNICIMGGGHFGRFYPYGDLTRNRIVNHTMDCYGCNWKCIYSETKCIENISSQDVISVIDNFLERLS